MLDVAREPSAPKTRLRSSGEGRGGEAGFPWRESGWGGREEYVEEVGEAWLSLAPLDEGWDARAPEPVVAVVEGPGCGWGSRCFLREKRPMSQPRLWQVRVCQCASS